MLEFQFDFDADACPRGFLVRYRMRGWHTGSLISERAVHPQATSPPPRKLNPGLPTLQHDRVCSGHQYHASLPQGWMHWIPSNSCNWAYYKSSWRSSFVFWVLGIFLPFHDTRASFLARKQPGKVGCTSSFWRGLPHLGVTSDMALAIKWIFLWAKGKKKERPSSAHPADMLSNVIRREPIRRDSGAATSSLTAYWSRESDRAPTNQIPLIGHPTWRIHIHQTAIIISPLEACTPPNSPSPSPPQRRRDQAVS